MNAEGDAHSVKLGNALFTLRRGEIFGSDGQRLSLRAKSARMMAMLLSEPERIFSKEEIAREVWPDVYASDESISQCITEIRRVLNDREHEIVVTYPKRGYSIHVGRAEVQRRNGDRVLRFIVSALLLTVVAVVLVVKTSGPDEHKHSVRPDVKSLRELVAVLPFQSLNNAGGDAYLTIGLAEDLIIQLSELSSVSVLPSSISFAAVNDTETPLNLAKMLNARYLVYGRIHHGKKVLQVSVQLIDGLEGTQVWAGKYDVVRDELLTYHQTVLVNLTNAMSVALSERDARLLEVPGTMNKHAFEKILRGREAANEFSVQANLLAEKYFREAIQLDPNYARAYAELAAVYAIRFENAWSVLLDADEEKALYIARKAIALDPELWLAQYAMGRIYSTVRNSDLKAAQRHLRLAMSLKPDNDDARIYLAAVMIFSGLAEEALAIIEPVLATHPAPPFWYFLSQGHSLFHLERYEEAAIALDTCLHQMPTSPYCLRYQIADYGLLEQTDDAEWAAEEYAALGHDPRVDSITGLLLDKDPDYIERVRKGIIAAGLD